MLTVTRLRLYPEARQEQALAKAFGCARWLWNNSLAETQRAYQETGKGLGQYALNKRLPELKKEHEWLAETHSQVLQSVSLHLSSVSNSCKVTHPHQSKRGPLVYTMEALKKGLPCLDWRKPWR